jgi:hypothetical protein
MANGSARNSRSPHADHKQLAHLWLTPPPLPSQPKVKDRVGNENNWIHVENSSADSASASAAAADGGGLPLPFQTLRSMNLLDAPESPRGSYTSEQPTQVSMCRAQRGFRSRDD